MSKFKKIIRFSVLTGLLVFFMYLAFKGIDFNGLISELEKTKYLYAILGTLIGAVFGSYIRALRWKYLLNPLKENISVKNLFSTVMIGYMMNALIPRAGEVSRPVLLAKKENISRASAFGTIVVERIFDMLSMFIVFGLCIMYYRQKISDTFGEFNIEMISLYFSIGILLFVLFVVIMLFNLEKTEAIVEKITSKILPAKYQEKIHKIFISLINGFLFIKYPKYYFKIFLLTVALWMSYAMATYTAFYAFDIHLRFIDANLVLTLMSFAQTLPLPGNSAGTFHLFTKMALVNIFGVSAETALGYATVSHLLGFITLLSIGFYYSIKENFKFNSGL
ncbi:MAG: flippase-like domain-containing protein [Ignavibacteriae bacterium]|nr:flippase-like domain-containing protein [Ignavibacteriota bacterium]